MRTKSWVDRLLAPWVALPLLVATLIVVVLLAPERELQPIDRSGPLTTTSTTPAGARGLYEIARKLGWPVIRSQRAFAAPLDSSRVYLVLDPPVPPSAIEAHALLDAVRRGAGLIYIVSGTADLDDSLHVGATGYNAMVPLARTEMGQPCPVTDPGAPAIHWPFDDNVHLAALGRTRAWPDDTTLFVAVRSDTARHVVRPAAVGYHLGAGRVVVLSDADLLRNDVIRVCRWGLGPAAVRIMDYASAGARPPLVFDEYHFSTQATANWWGAVGDFLAGTLPGRAVAQIAAAGLVLLVFAAWRPVAPVGRSRIERRSALEHVEALARAYARVGATRTVVRRLVRGLRRRHARRGVASTDDAYLASLATRSPGLATDVEHIRQGLEHTITPAELLAVGRAVDHIDRILSP